MDDRERNENFFDTIAKILIRSFFMGVAFLMFWFFLFLLGADRIYAMWSNSWFDLTIHEFQAANFYGMAFFKISPYLFFLSPYFAIRWVLRKKRMGR